MAVLSYIALYVGTVADHLQIELDNLAAGRADRDFGDGGAAGGGGGQGRGGSTPVHGGPILNIIINYNTTALPSTAVPS
jgi:hypothetical protein